MSMPPPPTGSPVNPAQPGPPPVGALPWWALGTSVLCGPVGLVLSLVSLSRWKRSPDLGRGVALVALVVSLATLVPFVLVTRLVIDGFQHGFTPDPRPTVSMSPAQEDVDSVAGYFRLLAGRSIAYVPASHELAIDGEGRMIPMGVRIVELPDGQLCAEEGGWFATVKDPTVRAGSCPAG